MHACSKGGGSFKLFKHLLLLELKLINGLQTACLMMDLVRKKETAQNDVLMNESAWSMETRTSTVEAAALFPDLLQ